MTRPTPALDRPAAAEGGARARPTESPRLRIAIFIVTFNAADTLSQVLERIPGPIWDRVEEVFVFDDSSEDDTYRIGVGYKSSRGLDKLSVFRNERNLGYGGNQIRGYSYALARGYDAVALLHGDGQYAPEVLAELLAPIEAGEADAVFGSRMMTPGAARAGGMPLYKYVGNRILTGFENSMLGTSLSEFHSGYRVYSRRALEAVPFRRNTHDFHFDTQIIIQLHAAGLRIVEVPIPTYYGDEICRVNGIGYAWNVVGSVVGYRFHELGLRHHPEYEVEPAYTLKRSPLSSHARLTELAGRAGMSDRVGPAETPPRRVLDVGCGRGDLGAELRRAGYHVTGVDRRPPPVELDRFVEADLGRGLPLGTGERFDVVLLADVLEHMADPLRLLREVCNHLAPAGSILVSLPNTVHWSVRAQVLLGRFDYTNKGLLDRGHLRLFTRASALRLFREAGLTAAGRWTTPVPWERVLPAFFGGFVRRTVERIDHLLGRLWPNLFAYQHLFELRLAAPEPVEPPRAPVSRGAKTTAPPATP